MVVSDQSEYFDQLLSRIWNEYERLQDSQYVVRSSIPILFFGDSKRYLSSPCKVVTVGLNPSCAEFPDVDRFLRFPNMNDIAADLFRRVSSRYVAALDSYFRCHPYKTWFASFEHILTGMGCSFYDGCENTALHTDLCSPIATSPTWAKLSKDQQAHLLLEGVTLWHSLIRTLEPDVILISVAKRFLKQIEFHHLGSSRVIWKLERAQPYEVSATPIEIRPTKPSLLIFGRAAQTPFGTISKTQKVELGAFIKEYFHAASR